MKKEKKLKWLKIVYWLFIILLFGFTFVWVNNYANNEEYWETTEVKILNEKNVSFIQQETIKQLIKESNLVKENLLLDTLNRQNLERLIKQNPFVKDVRVFTGFNGKVQVEVLQREALLRIHKLDSVFYLDKNGDRFPFSTDYSSRVPVFQIDLPTFVDKDIMKFYKQLEKNEFIHTQLSNIYVNKFQEISMVSKFGNFIIDFGPNEDIENKFERFETAANTILQNEGWEKYSKISLAFKNQVVCTKREE